MKPVLKELILSTPEGLHLTGQEIADIIGISRSSLYSVFRGTKGLTLNEAEVIAGEFDLTLDQISFAMQGKLLL